MSSYPTTQVGKYPVGKYVSTYMPTYIWRMLHAVMPYHGWKLGIELSSVWTLDTLGKYLHTYLQYIPTSYLHTSGDPGRLNHLRLVQSANRASNPPASHASNQPTFHGRWLQTYPTRAGTGSTGCAPSGYRGLNKMHNDGRTWSGPPVWGCQVPWLLVV